MPCPLDFKSLLVYAISTQPSKWYFDFVMKLTLAGVAGFISAKVSQQCLANPAIDVMVGLSRRPLNRVPDLRLKVFINKDFTIYEG